jgi:probable addiction module antidote protein
MPLNTTRWNSAEHLKTEEDIQAYLNACVEESDGDPALIIHAVGVIARARTMNRDRASEPSSGVEPQVG